MKPNSSMLKLAAAVLLAMGLAACENEGGQGDTDLYGPETEQQDAAQPGSPDGVVPDTTGQQTVPGSYESQQPPRNNIQQPAGEGDVDLYGTQPDQNVPTDSPYGDEAGPQDQTTDDRPLPIQP